MDSNTPTAEMPRYKCHKEVRALKIKSLALDPITLGVCITPEDASYRPIIAAQEWAQRCKPQVGGYYVVYDDGYSSYSPAKVFEDGYTRIES